MSTNDDTPESSDETADAEARRHADDQRVRYKALEAADGVFVVFDRENPDAWVQSDQPVGLHSDDEE